MLFLVLITICHPQTAYIDKDFYFSSDTTYILSDSVRVKNEVRVSIKDTVNNLALTFLLIKGDSLKLDSLVNSKFALPGDFDYTIDSLQRDSLDVIHYYKYGTAPLNDSLDFISFALGKQFENCFILLINAVYNNPVGMKYLKQFDNFHFSNEDTVGTVIVPTKIKNRWKPTKSMMLPFNGWVYNVKGIKKIGLGAL